MLVNKLSKGIGLSLLAALAFVFVACTSPSSSSSSSGTTDTTGGGGTPDDGGGTTSSYPTITFDEDGTPYTLSAFEGATSTLTTVVDAGIDADSSTDANVASAKIYKVVNGFGAGTQDYSGVNFLLGGDDSKLSGFLNFSPTGNRIVSARVFAPAAEIPVTAQADTTDAAGGTAPVQVTVLTTKAGWQTLTWDFGATNTGDVTTDYQYNGSSNTYTDKTLGWDFKGFMAFKNTSTIVSNFNPVKASAKFTIFFDFHQKRTENKTFYIDNVRFGPADGKSSTAVPSDYIPPVVKTISPCVKVVAGGTDGTAAVDAKVITFDETGGANAYDLEGFEGGQDGTARTTIAAETATTETANCVAADSGANAASGNIYKFVSNLKTAATHPGQPWAGVNVRKAQDAAGMSTFLDLGNSKVISARIYAPAADIPVTAKVDVPTDAEVTVLTTKAGWQNITWDFGQALVAEPGASFQTTSASGGWDFKGWWATLPGTPTYSLNKAVPATATKLAIFFDFQQPKTEYKVFYIDNIRFGAAPQ